MSAYNIIQEENLKDFVESNVDIKYYKDEILALGYLEQDELFRIQEIDNDHIFGPDGALSPRQAVETVLDYYNYIFLGVIAGHFPLKIDLNLTDEIIRFLEFQPVNTYYRSTNESFLPNATLGY